MLIVAAVIICLTGGSYFALQSSKVQTYLTQIAAKYLSEKIGAQISIGKVDVAFFKKVILKDVLVEDQQADTLIFVKSISATIDSLKFKKHRISLGKLEFKNTKLNACRDSSNVYNFDFIFNALKKEEKEPGDWSYSCRNFVFTDAGFSFADFTETEPFIFNIADIQLQSSGFYLKNDSATLQIDQLTLNDGKQFIIQEFNVLAAMSGNKITLDNFNLTTGFSQITESNFSIELPAAGEDFIESVQFDLEFLHSQISFSDISLFVPSLKGMDHTIDCSGRISGNSGNVRGKDIELLIGRNTFASLDFSANDISNTETMYLFFDLKKAQASFNELSRIKLPEGGKNRYLKFPDELYQAGLVSYRGNFTGFLTDFVTYGTLSSEMGRITTDLSVLPGNRKRITYRGKIATENFKLGELIKSNSIGDITFNGSVDGRYTLATHAATGKFTGDISHVEINNYLYKNIRLDGILDNKMFDGMAVMNDSNLQFDFLGKVNFNPELPVFDFRLDLQKAQLDSLNFSNKYPDAQLSFLMDANFSGNRIDNLIGSIIVQSGAYKNQNGEIDLSGIQLKSISSGLNDYLTFSSPMVDVEINGHFHVQNIMDALGKSMQHYLPAIGFKASKQAMDNKFGYQINVKNLDSVTAAFIPEIKIETPFLLYGQMDSDNSVFELKGSIPAIRSEKMMIRNIFIGNNPHENIYVSRFMFGEILLKNGIALNNLTIDSKIANNTISNQIVWGKDEKDKYSGEILGRATLSQTRNSPHLHFDIEGADSHISIGDSTWRINPFTAGIDSSCVKVSNLKIHSSNQQIILDGMIAENDSSTILALFDNIKLSNIEAFLETDLPLTGTLNGLVQLNDYYGQRLLLSNLKVDDLVFREHEIGNMSVFNIWEPEKRLLNSDLKIEKNERHSLRASGSYNPETREISYDVNADHLSLVVLETVIRNTFSNFHGDGTGRVKIHGTPDNIQITGAVEALNAGLTIDFTQVSYNFSDSIYFRGDSILFKNISITDFAGNKGTFGGAIVHKNFSQMRYNLSVTTPRIVAINTTPRDNPQFYGQVITNGRINITGSGNRVRLSGSGTTLAGTNVNISLEDESELERYDFIQFVSTEDTVRQQFLFPRRDDGAFTMDLTITATPEAKVQLIYNSYIGDVIRAQGEGILRFGINNDGDITLSGTYSVEKGDYLFTLQNVINKRFTIEQGGTITWSENPYNADINIKAVYKLKASLYDLLVNTYENVYQHQRIPVECKIILTEELSNPSINFAIDFPSVEDRLVEEVKQFFNTPEEMNKQILSLVVLGKFYTPEYLRGTYEAQNPNLIGTTASELLSNQLSNWLSQINSNLDIGLNYRPGSQITNNEIELALSTQMFNDRVTINGNIGNNNNPNSNNNSQLVGDFDINVKLTPNGKLRLKAYNRSNNNLIYETSPYTQGVGFSFTEEYNTIDDLFDKIKAIFSRRED